MTNKLVVIINSLKVPKIKKILLYEKKFLVPNCSCPQIPVLPVHCPQLNLWNLPTRTKFLGTPPFVRETQVTSNWNITSGPFQFQAYYTKLRTFNLSFFTLLLSYFIFRSFLFCYNWKLQCVTNMNATWEPQNSQSCLLSNYVSLQINSGKLQNKEHSSVRVQINM